MDEKDYQYNNWNLNLPGNLNKEEALQQFIRVNHAGELAAVEIYRWQAKIITELRCELRMMQVQEQIHLTYFENAIYKNDYLQKSKLWPLWKLSGIALGISTALLGKQAAKICTEAVEDVIVDHYDEQLAILSKDHDSQIIYQDILKIRNEELEHKHDADKFSEKPTTFCDRLLRRVIKKGCKIAIKIAKRI